LMALGPAPCRIEMRTAKAAKASKQSDSGGILSCALRMDGPWPAPLPECRRVSRQIRGQKEMSRLRILRGLRGLCGSHFRSLLKAAAKPCLIRVHQGSSVSKMATVRAIIAPATGVPPLHPLEYLAP
jgi:hypothetical protein